MAIEADSLLGISSELLLMIEFMEKEQGLSAGLRKLNEAERLGR